MTQGFSRRTLFNRFSVAGVTAFLGLRCAGQAEARVFTAEKVVPQVGRIVDMHVHYRHDEPGFLDNYLKLADRLNITACMLTPFEHRKVIADAARKFPKRIVPFGALEFDATDATQQMREFHDLGYRGLGEISSMQKNCSDQKYFPIFELASQYKWILMFHTGIVGRDDFNKPENVASGRMRPIHLEEIARQFPKLTILGAHLGNPEYEWAAEVTRWNPNVYFDLSGTTLTKMAPRLTDFQKVFWWADDDWEAQPTSDKSPYSKVVFGSDTRTDNIERVIGKYWAMFEACNVPGSTRKSIMGGTLSRMLELAD
jgi:predicted TIM-barrel fold metal-dependent hydrolase